MAVERLQQLVDELCEIEASGCVTVLTSVLQARPDLAVPVVAFAVPELTYPPSKALTEKRAYGTIKSYNAAGGFGFIHCDELKQVFGHDIFVHAKQIAGLQPGTAVNFAIMMNKDNKPQGYDLQADDGVALSKGSGKDQSKGEAPAWNNNSNNNWSQNDSWGSNSSGGGKGHGGKSEGNSWSGGGGWGSWDSKGKGKGKDSNKPRVECKEDAEYLGEYVGSIKSFNNTNGFGFIDCQDLKDLYNNDVFLHKFDYQNQEHGTMVMFDAYLNSAGKPQAKNLRAADGSAPPADAGEQYESQPQKRPRNEAQGWHRPATGATW